MPSSQAAFASCDDPQRLLEPFIAAVADYALLLLDPDGRVLSWNRGAELISGYHADEIIGRHFSCLYAPEDVAAGKPRARTGRLRPSMGVTRRSANASGRMDHASLPMS